MQIVGIIVGVLVVIFVLGMILMPKQKNVAAKYEKAMGLFENGDMVETLAMMDELIVFTFSEKYTYEAAQQMIKSLELLKAVTVDQNINIDNLINPVKIAAESISADGGKIDMDITDPLDKWISKAGSDIGNTVEDILKAAENGEIEIIEKDNEADFTDDVTDSRELEIINSMGKYILGRKYKEGITFVDSHIPEEMNAFKASLMDQKAGLMFMDGKVSDAIDIYEEILVTYPDNNRIRAALAEGLVETGNANEAVKHATTVTQMSKDKDLVKTCQKIVKKYS